MTQPGLKDLATAKWPLSTRVIVIREIQAAVRADLSGAEGAGEYFGTLDGPLGEQIAVAAGSIYMERLTADAIRDGICNWLDKYFLPDPPQKNGSREGTEDASPPPCIGGEDGSRVLALAFRKGEK